MGLYIYFSEDNKRNSIENFEEELFSNKKTLIFNESDYKKKPHTYFIQKKKEGFYLVFDAENCDSIRLVVERKLPNAIINAEYNLRKDYNYQPDSGLDYTTIKKMKELGITYCIDLKKLKQSINRGKLNIYNRVKQNVLLCEKYHCNYFCFGANSSLIRK